MWYYCFRSPRRVMVLLNGFSTARFFSEELSFAFGSLAAQPSAGQRCDVAEYSACLRLRLLTIDVSCTGASRFGHRLSALTTHGDSSIVQVGTQSLQTFRFTARRFSVIDGRHSPTATRPFEQITVTAGHE